MKFVLPFASRSRFEVSWHGGEADNKGEREETRGGRGVGAGGLGGGGERDRSEFFRQLASGEGGGKGAQGEEGAGGT